MDDLHRSDAERIARALSDGRRISRNGDGWKTYCPLCNSNSRRRKPRATLSITVRDRRILVFCHRCQSDRVAIIRELVRLELLPNYFREESLAFALVDDVRAATAAVTWKGIAAATDLKVLQTLFGIVRKCCKPVFDGSAREVGERARVDLGTASRSLHRLVAAGWLEQISRARGERPATWRLRVPPDTRDRGATIRHAEGAGNGLLEIDPCFPRGDRAGSVRSAPSFDHDLFRCGKGLGPIKGRIYSVLAVSMTAAEIARTLDYKHTRNVTLHLQVLARQGLVRRLNDGRFERSDVDLDAIAAGLGVLGAGEKQRARHGAERAEWRRWYNAFVHWRQTGEIIDPQTSEILEAQDIPGKRARVGALRYRVLSIRARRVEVREAQLQSASEPSDLASGSCASSEKPVDENV